MKIGIIFGSSSNEHDISVASLCSIIKNIDKDKYEVVPIYLDLKNNFYLWDIDINQIAEYPIGFKPTNLKKITLPFRYLKEFDLIFIMVHGKNGEDGILSSILEFLNIPFIGNKHTSSVITMDKILTKIILEHNNIKTSPYLYFIKRNNEYIYQNKTLTKKEIYDVINKKLTYPLFVKPSNSGSSIGITKVYSIDELDKAINKALDVDYRILIESEVKGRELECGILENNGEIIASSIGEVTTNDYYSYDAKYKSRDSNTIIPADINPKIARKIKKLAINIFKILDLHGFSRCDFFLTSDNKIYLNEINTIPGFTTISMYPKLFNDIGITYQKLLDILINNSFY